METAFEVWWQKWLSVQGLGNETLDSGIVVASALHFSCAVSM